MSRDKKADKTIVYYVVGGAVVGAIAGYIVKKVGFKNILNVLKSKNIIPENIAETISEFTSKDQDSEIDEDLL
jgi:hypothetical protein